MTLTPGQRLELTLGGFAHDGRAVGRPDGGGPAIFVSGGLPGRRVLAEIAVVRKRMAEGSVLETLTPVPPDQGGERTAPCPHAGECGGCPWQELPYPSQLVWKKKLVEDALEKIGRIDCAGGRVRPVLPSPDTDRGPGEWRYRNKMEFAFAPDEDGRPLLGLRRRASREVVEVTGCLLQTSGTMSVLASLRDLTARSGLPAWKGKGSAPGSLRFAVIREPRGDGASAPCLVEIITGPTDAAAGRIVARLGEELLAGSGGVTGFVHSVRSGEADIACGEKTMTVLGETRLEERLRLVGHAAPVTFRLGHQAFFQVNTGAAELLYNTAAGMALSGPPARAEKAGGVCWDIYCGVGGLALTMAPRFRRVMGLESVPAAVSLARKNAEAFPQCRFETAHAGKLGEFFRRRGVPDLLCADPPRSGLDDGAVRALLRGRPAHLLLVSCNPATLARDLAALSAIYRLEAVQPVDLFPQTPHVETAAFLTLRG